MIIKKIEPVGWPCKIDEVPPGHFIPLAHPEMLCFRSEYQIEDIYNDAGEFMHVESGELFQPVTMVIEEVEV